MKRETLIAGGILLLGAVYAYWALAYTPLAKKLHARRQVLAAQERELQAARQLVAHYDEYRERAVTLQIQARRLETRLPGQPQMPALLKDITRVATECNIREFEFTPLPPAAKAGYLEQPVRITLLGTYHHLGQFLTQLALLPRLVAARDIKLSSRDKNDRNQSLAADLVLDTYVVK